METTKQKFTIEFEYPIMDAKVTAEELRDAFYENFKELIEQCKELL